MIITSERREGGLLYRFFFVLTWGCDPSDKGKRVWCCVSGSFAWCNTN